jgi:hypothetical protein
MVHVVVEQRERRGDREPREQGTSGDQAHDRLADPGHDLLERQPQPGFEQDDAHRDRDERLVERAQQVVRMHVVGRDPGEEPRRQQYDDGRRPQRSCKQLRADGQDEHEPKAKQDLVRRHRRRLTSQAWVDPRASCRRTAETAGLSSPQADYTSSFKPGDPDQSLSR